MNRDNTPTFNVNRKVANFKDFLENEPSEMEELTKIKRQTKPNSTDGQQIIGNHKVKYNKATHKLDTNLDPEMIDDKIDALEESKIFETHIDDNVYHELKQSSAYHRLVDEFRNAIRDFENRTSNIYDEGDNDHMAAFQAVLQDAIDEAS
jgi:uncharacterized membrane-anchored protein YjiN (DUF445 family)